MSRKHWIALTAFCVIALFGVVWGVGYVVHIIPEDSWMEFPLIFTSMILGAFAYVGAMACLFKACS